MKLTIDGKELQGRAGQTIDEVVVTSRRGHVELKAWVTDRVEDGTLFMPFHFAEASANVLTNNALDPIGKIPEYKVCAVKIEKRSKRAAG